MSRSDTSLHLEWRNRKLNDRFSAAVIALIGAAT
jgi:hypothetical protein